MNAERFFVDTNILVYAYDLTAGEKRRKASSCLERLWEEENGVLSTQVLQEFAAVVTRKLPKPLSPEATGKIIADLVCWDVHVNTPRDILEALNLQKKHLLSFWDALVITAALQSGANVMLSEDFSPKLKIAGLAIRNPFL
jgi:predicted nucleic acid-binding protein